LAARDDIIGFLDELLDAGAWSDYGPNGLQVVGAAEVEHVATGVSAHRELFERAGAEGAQLVLCHHGLFWKNTPQVVGAQMKARLKALFDSDMSLAAYHLPLDAHPELGNNALICAALGLERGEQFANVGFVGRPPEALALDELVERCTRAFGGRAPLVLRGGADPVRSVGVISGGAASALADAAEHGLEAMITGEPSEPAMADARETGVTLIAGGHYATETFGVRALGDLLAERFGVRHTFVEVPNPV
jgi:dinuclear metal center YbgI/SA1388 family protein